LNTPPDISQARSRLALASRRKGHDPQAIEDARRDLAAAKIAAYVARSVASAPKLTREQRARLVTLLSATPSGGGSDA
jgi:hypothetical protein